ELGRGHAHEQERAAPHRAKREQFQRRAPVAARIRRCNGWGCGSASIQALLGAIHRYLLGYRNGRPGADAAPRPGDDAAPVTATLLAVSGHGSAGSMATASASQPMATSA